MVRWIVRAWVRVMVRAREMVGARVRVRAWVRVKVRVRGVRNFPGSWYKLDPGSQGSARDFVLDLKIKCPKITALVFRIKA